MAENLASETLSLLRRSAAKTLAHGEVLILLSLLLGILIYAPLIGSTDALTTAVSNITSLVGEGGQFTEEQVPELTDNLAQIGNLLFLPSILFFFLTPIYCLIWTRTVAFGRKGALSDGLGTALGRYVRLLWVSFCMFFVLILFVLLAGLVNALIGGLLGVILGLIGLGGVGQWLAGIIANAVLLVAMAGFYLAVAAHALDRGHGIFAGIKMAVEEDGDRSLILALILMNILASLLQTLLITLTGGAFSLAFAISGIVSVITSGIGLAAAIQIVLRREVQSHDTQERF